MSSPSEPISERNECIFLRNLEFEKEAIAYDSSAMAMTYSWMVYWQLETNLDPDKKDLTAATLKSIALNYIQRKGPSLPKSLLRAANQLKRRDDIVIVKPDKGTGVVVMDKNDYMRLLKKASIDNENKFQAEETKTKRKTHKALSSIAREREGIKLTC